MNIFRKKTQQQLLQAVEKTNLKKNLTIFDLTALGIGSVVGTGIFVATGQGAMLAGPAVIISLVIAAITACFCALTYAELAAMFPVAGSTYSYAYIAFGELIAWIVGWNLMSEYLIAASAVASAWSATIIELLKSYGINLPHALVATPLTHGIVDLPAVLLTLFCSWILFVGIKESSRFNNIIVIVKIIVIGFFIFLGCSHVNSANFHPFAPFGWKGIFAGSAVMFFAYIGFDAVSTAAEETSNPKRHIPLALLLCLTVTILLYVGVGLVLTGMVPFKNIDVSNALPSALLSTGIRWGGALVAVGAIIGMISTFLITLYGQIRVFMVMARDGLLPKAFAKIHPQHRTPHICTWVTGAVTAAIAGLLPLPMIIDLCNIGTLFAFILVSIGVLVLRKTMPDHERKFKCPWVPLVPILTILFCFYLMLNLQKITWINFCVWLIIGLIIYFSYGIKNSAKSS